MNGQYKYGYIEGGTAQDVEVGFRPSKVRITDLSGKAAIFEATLDDLIEFDSGGTGEIQAGWRVRASDGGWDGIVSQVLLTGGAWSAGTAAGWLVMAPGMTGAANIADNDGIFATEYVDLVPTVNHADVDTAARLATSWTIAAAVAASASTIVPYNGSAPGNAVGFSVTVTPGSAGQILLWEAWTANCDGE